MVRVKNILILLLTLVLFFNSPAYPKGIKVRYLPYDITMDSVSKDCTNPDAPNKGDPGYESDFIVLSQIDPRACAQEFKGIASCRKCAKWQKDCPNCCLTDDHTAIKCTAEESEDYNCTDPPFQADECSKVECANDDNDCDDKLECSGGLVKSGSPYGLQRRGCPEEGSEDLAPNGSCILLSGSGLDRKWKCPSGDLQPKSAECVPDAETGLSKPDTSAYYVVTKAEPVCKPDCSVSFCTSDCSSASTGCKVLSDCTPSCTPTCDTDCFPSCYLNCSTPESCKEFATCTPHSCVANSCWPGCSKEESCPPGGGECSSWCTKTSCEPPKPGCSSSCTPEDRFYIYTLSGKVKDYIRECVSYADAYEECKDQIICCQENVCSGKKKGGFDANCDKGNKCNDRVGCIKADFCDETKTAGECIADVRLAAECLSDKEKDEDADNHLSLEITSAVQYSFTARSGESLIIDWNVVLDSLPSDEIEKMEGISFYTFVRVEEVEDANAPAPHISALTIRDMENAFSIYGLTNVPAKDLTPGKKYVVKIYYFFPRVMECGESTGYAMEAVNSHTVKVKQLYLNVVKVKE